MDPNSNARPESSAEKRNEFIVLKDSVNDVNSFYANNSRDGLAKPEEIELITDPVALKKKRNLLLKNLLIIGFGWIFQFTAYSSISNLQSSLNSDDGLGTISLSVIYVSILLSCIFLPSMLISKLGVKYTILFSQMAYLLYIAANLYPRHYTLIPAAVILGAGAAPLWTAKCKMLTDMGIYNSKISGEKAEPIINRYFGIFFAMFQSSNIWGNIISSTVLKPVVANESAVTNISFCGFYDYPGSASVEIKKPKMSTVYLLCGIYIGIAVAGIIFIFLLLDTYKKIGLDSLKKEEKNPVQLLVNTLRHLRNKRQLLIIPLTLWSGFEQAYISADFTKSFVSCVRGVDNVGLVMICYGVADVLGSYGFGFAIKFLGRIPIFMFAALSNYAIIIAMIFWEPSEATSYSLFLMAVAWGLSDAVWQTQINSFYGVIFSSEQEAAFSNYRLWESLGFAIAYAYSNVLSIRIKLFLLTGYLTLGILGYGAIEFDIRKEKNKMAAISA